MVLIKAISGIALATVMGITTATPATPSATAQTFVKTSCRDTVHQGIDLLRANGVNETSTDPRTVHNDLLDFATRFQGDAATRAKVLAADIERVC